MKSVNNIFYFFNKVLAILTLVGFALPYLAPRLFPILSLLTLILPLLLIFNLLFVLYWILNFKRRLFLSLIVFFLGVFFFGTFYKLNEKVLPKSADDFIVMSYNVRLFNRYDWIKDTNVNKNITEFIKDKQPDIVCLQEYTNLSKLELKDYPFQFLSVAGKKVKSGQAIFSKFKIIDKGAIKFPSSNNKVIYADVIKKSDTIRIYNMHLESVNISSQVQNGITESESKKVITKLSNAFKKQQLQSELIKEHVKLFKGKKIICGDMNNTSYSYTYKNIRQNMKDAFIEAGQGLGKSYDYLYYPTRIDYIFVDDVFEVKQFDTFSNFKNSDHFPIVSRLGSMK